MSWKFLLSCYENICKLGMNVDGLVGVSDDKKFAWRHCIGLFLSQIFIFLSLDLKEQLYIQNKISLTIFSENVYFILHTDRNREVGSVQGLFSLTAIFKLVINLCSLFICELHEVLCPATRWWHYANCSIKRHASTL